MQEHLITFDEKFWLAIAFVGFVLCFIKYALPLIRNALDNKSKEIAQNLLHAKEMKEQAQELLASCEKSYEDTVKYCEKITKDAIIEAEKLLQDIQNQARLEIEKKTQALNNRIKTEEENAVREIKIKIIASAMLAAQANLADLKKEDVKNSLNDISKLIH